MPANRKRTTQKRQKEKLTKIDAEQGSVDANSPMSLKEAGNAALEAGDVARATHMYTLGVDMVLGDHATAESIDWYELDRKSDGGGLLHALLSNRSLAHYKQKDFAAAIDDAERCVQACPDFARGHIRLLSALKAERKPLQEQREACSRGLRACPSCEELQQANIELAGDSSSVNDDEEVAKVMEVTRRIANDPRDPKHAMAAGDLGSALAVGAHGEEQNLVEAEKFLRIGAKGGDAASQRNLGLLLLDLQQAGEAAQHLQAAATQGDDHAAEVLTALRKEAEQKAAAARFQLSLLASQGDERAKAMLEQLQSEGGLQ